MHCFPVYSHRHRVYVVNCYSIEQTDTEVIVYSDKDTIAYKLPKSILKSWSGGGTKGHYGISFEYTKEYMVDILN